jgi:hypothetical protein
VEFFSSPVIVCAYTVFHTFYIVDIRRKCLHE